MTEKPSLSEGAGLAGIPGPQVRLLREEVAAHPFPLLFVTVSGAHLYGFASADSDFDLRGVHLLPLANCIGLDKPRETVEIGARRPDPTVLEIDLVTHDLRKFSLLLLRNNGYVLEQLYSPLIVVSTPAHDELKQIASGCLTRRCVDHYLGFAQSQWGLFLRHVPHRVKHLLYVYRVLLSGLHLMRAGEINANLQECNRGEQLPYIEELVARKVEGEERGDLGPADLGFHEREVARLRGKLQAAAETSHLPASATCRAELNEFVVRLRQTGILSPRA